MENPLLPIWTDIFNLFLFVTTIYNAMGIDQPLIVELLNGALSPLQGGYIALVYILDGDTFKRINYRNIRASITRRNTVQEYPFENAMTGLSDSAELAASYILHDDNGS